MNEEIQRPDPEQLLKQIQAEEKKETKGKLKIFFGMAAGVGKTFAMLQAAHDLKNRGVDVVIGYIETHNRPDTEKLVKGLTIIPRKKIEYRGVVVEEMDLNSILDRKPYLVLVDELAHTNVPGSRHPKRYQDIMELLDNGVNVYTTINVQHLESRSELVEKIAETSVKERIPDSILEIANEVELVDLVPEDLLKRLSEGKIYEKEKVEAAKLGFFKKSNLTALREMALQLTTGLVDKELDKMKVQNDNLKLSGKILLGVGSGPDNESLIRYAKRFAFSMKSEWTVVFVDTGKKINKETRNLISSHLNLAKELGAEVVTILDDNVVNGLLRAANQTHGIHLIIGNSKHKGIFDFVRGGTIADKLLNVHTQLYKLKCANNS